MTRVTFLDGGGDDRCTRKAVVLPDHTPWLLVILARTTVLRLPAVAEQESEDGTTVRLAAQTQDSNKSAYFGHGC